jgi:hypothetical protein
MRNARIVTRRFHAERPRASDGTREPARQAVTGREERSAQD